MLSPNDAGVQMSRGANDPRLCDIDEDFRRILVDLSVIVKASRLQKDRAVHGGNASAALGVLQVLDDLDLPEHDFFRPGRTLPVVARYSNGSAGDDISPTVRGCTLRLLDPETPTQIDTTLLDLTLSTGECFYAGSAEVFHRYYTDPAGRAELAAAIPQLRPAAWDSYRTATSYAGYEYFSQVPRGFVDRTGGQWLARYRLVPAGEPIQAGAYDPAGRDFPPDPPESLPRPDGDSRPADYLHQELRSRVLADGVDCLLQIQLHPVNASAADNEDALDASRPWPVELCPWRDLAQLRLRELIDLEAVQALRFNPAAGPPELGIVLARSAGQAASLNHLRVLVYRMASAARSGEPMPADLAALLRPRSASKPPARVAERDRPRTVCVIGAGPAGLSAARELERAGHRAIVLEARTDVAGKCESAEIDGRAYDLGGHLCTTQYQRLAELVSELGLATEDTTPHRVYDVAEGRSAPQDSSFFRRETYQRYASLRAAHFPRIAEPGLAHSARALAQPVAEWLADNGLEALGRSLGVGYTAAGYGPLTGDLPALYFVKYVELTGLLSTRPELLGHAGSFTISGGFQSLWQRVAAELADVRRGVRITSITRHDDGVLVQLFDANEPIEADDLMVTVPIGGLLPVLDVTAEERALAARVRTLDYHTTLCTASGLPRSAFYLVDQYTRPGAELGHWVAFHHRYADRNEYACYSYGEPEHGPDDIAEFLAKDVTEAGGRLHTVHLQRRWPFMPHFGSVDLADGVYDRIERLQGALHTYHLGSLPAFELVETNIGYAQDLVRRFFPALVERPVAVEPAEPSAVDLVAVQPAARAVTAEELRGWLVSRVATELQLPEAEVDPSAPIELYALDSLSTAALLAELSDWLGYRVAPTLLFELPTLSAVARQLAGDGAGARGGPAVAEEQPGPRQPKLLLGLTPVRPLFCVGGVLGAAYYLRPLARALGHSCHFYGVQAPGYDGREEPLEDVPAIAARYLEEIRAAHPNGPYLLAGHSFGGLVAYEMGRQLQAADEDVAKVLLLDTYVPLPAQPVPAVDEAAAITELLTMARLTYTAEVQPIDPVGRWLSEEDQRDQLLELLGGTSALPIEEQLHNALAVYHSNLAATVRYQPASSTVPTVLLKAAGGFPAALTDDDRQVLMHLDDERNGWERLDLPNLEVITVPGNHFNMLSDAHVEDVADAVRHCLIGTVWRTTRA